MRYLLVEGITDVSLVKYIYQEKLNFDFNYFSKITSNTALKSPFNIYQYKNKDFYIIDLNGQDNLVDALKAISPNSEKIEKIGIIQDADDDFDKSNESVQKAILDAQIPNEEINCFLTPNHKDNGDLETLLLSTIVEDNKIMGCFDDYRACLEKQQTIHPKP